MQILALDTSTDLASCALWADGRVIAREAHAGQTHSELMLPMIDALLGDCGTTLKALDGIAFGAGPGAFTGLRIACGIAQGMALGVGCPVLGIGTLVALAEATDAPRVIACLDARLGEVYHAAYERDGVNWREVTPVGLCRAADVPVTQAGDWVGVGNGFRAYGPALAERLGARLARVESDRLPRAREIAVLAAARFAAGEGVDPADAAPVYIRDKVALRTDERAAR